MTWNWYGTPKASGGISGMQSDVRPVSRGFSARLTLYFSAPGFKVGPVAAPPPRPLPPPPNAYTPEKSGLPSGVRAIPALAGVAATDGASAVGAIEAAPVRGGERRSHVLEQLVEDGDGEASEVAKNGRGAAQAAEPEHPGRLGFKSSMNNHAADI